MKKQWFISLILVIVLFTISFSGCKSKKSEETVDVELVSKTSPTVTSTPATAAFNYSEGIDDKGFWEGIRALDYVKLCQYREIPVPGEVHNITDGAVRQEIEAILGEYATQNRVTDRAVVDGDTVNIDYVGSVDGVEFEGGSTKGAGTDVTIRVTRYIDGFLQQLIGHYPGETFNIEVTFPEDYGVDALNGKDAIFITTINYIVEKVYPELTDKFVEDNLSSEYGWRSVEEMESQIRQQMRSNAISDYLQNYVLSNSTITSIPEAVIKYQENTVVNYYRNYANYAGLEFEKFLQSYMGISDVAELLEKNKKNILDTASLGLVLQAIAEDASIIVDENDVAAYFQEYAGVTDYSTYSEHFGMPYLKMVTMNKEVVDFLIENAVLQ